MLGFLPPSNPRPNHQTACNDVEHARRTIYGKGAGRLLTTDSAKVASQVRFLDEGYWQPYGIQRPRMEVLAKTASCLVVDVAGQRMAWVQGRLPAVVPASPESVSALLLSRGAVQPLREVGAFFRAEVIVLDGSLSLARREGYLEEASAANSLAMAASME